MATEMVTVFRYLSVSAGSNEFSLTIINKFCHEDIQTATIVVSEWSNSQTFHVNDLLLGLHYEKYQKRCRCRVPICSFILEIFLWTSYVPGDRTKE